MHELRGVTAALLGSVFGGGIATPRYMIGALFLLPFALRVVRKFSDIREFLAILGLGIMFFAVLLSEPVGHEFMVGLLIVVFGIATVTSNITPWRSRKKTT